MPHAPTIHQPYAAYARGWSRPKGIGHASTEIAPRKPPTCGFVGFVTERSPVHTSWRDDHHAPSGYKPDITAGHGACTMQPPRRCSTQYQLPPSGSRETPSPNGPSGSLPDEAAGQLIVHRHCIGASSMSATEQMPPEMAGRTGHLDVGGCRPKSSASAPERRAVQRRGHIVSALTVWRRESSPFWAGLRPLA